MTPRVAAVLALALEAGCTGTEGTLLVRDGTATMGPPVDYYVPAENLRWLTRLDGAVDVEQAADFFYLDPEQQPAADLARLHTEGRRYLCYLSAGTLEDFREDVSGIPESAVGEPLQGFPNERWWDVRHAQVRELTARRIQALAEAGCDGVIPASLGGYAADTGFDLSLSDSLTFARWVADRIHAAGMSAGLTGSAEMNQELWPTFDFALAIGCVQSTGCSEYAVFREANKPVLHLELGQGSEVLSLCKSAQSLGIEALVSDPGFTGACVVCRDIL